MTACVAHFKEQTRAGERLGQPPRCTTKTGPQALYPTEVDVRFPPGVWSDFPKGTLGDEVKTALSFCWDNIRPALPKEIGVAALVDICELGCRHYVENFPSFLKPPSEWGPVRKARVMAKDADWFAVAQGLIEAGVFGVVPESEVFRVNSKLLLNGLFGVEKGEEDQGIPIYRLIMNLGQKLSKYVTIAYHLMEETMATQRQMQVAAGTTSGEMKANRGGRILSIGLFDGIGSLRVALDLLGCDVAGHISVEKDPGARRVVEHHFPGTIHYPDIVEVKEKDVKAWALAFGQDIIDMEKRELWLVGETPWEECVQKGGRCERNFAMPKVVFEGTTQARRAIDRQKLGSLKQLTVQPSTRACDDKALQKFLGFLKAEGLELPRKRELLDTLVMEYVEHLWISGEGRGLAADTLASLQDYDAKLRGHLPGSWRLVKTWVTHELPNRAPPVPELVLHSMVGWALYHGHFAFGTSLLLCFYGILRTGELLDVNRSRIEISPKLRTAVVSLKLTKAGKRAGVQESNVKWRKPHKPPVKPFDTNRWKFKGNAWRGNKPYFGKYALQILEEAWINPTNIEACRRMMVRTTRKDGGKVWLRVFPHSAITWRGKETRMGGGKGTIQYWVQAVRPGFILFELDGCTEATAHRAFNYCSRYLPFKTKMLVKDTPSRFELGLAGSVPSAVCRRSSAWLRIRVALMFTISACRIVSVNGVALLGLLADINLRSLNSDEAMEVQAANVLGRSPPRGPAARATPVPATRSPLSRGGLTGPMGPAPRPGSMLVRNRVANSWGAPVNTGESSLREIPLSWCPKVLKSGVSFVRRTNSDSPTTTRRNPSGTTEGAAEYRDCGHGRSTKYFYVHPKTGLQVIDTFLADPMKFFTRMSWTAEGRMGANNGKRSRRGEGQGAVQGYVPQNGLLSVPTPIRSTSAPSLPGEPPLAPPEPPGPPAHGACAPCPPGLGAAMPEGPGAKRREADRSSGAPDGDWKTIDLGTGERARGEDCSERGREDLRQWAPSSPMVQASRQGIMNHLPWLAEKRTTLLQLLAEWSQSQGYFLGLWEQKRKNLTGARQLFEEGARFGEGKAMTELGVAYRDGWGGAKDLDLATQWFERAADFTVEAMHQSYLMYSQETPQRLANESLAQLFLERAARMGHEEAMKRWVEPLARAKRWQEVVPWLLRMQSKASLVQFVKLQKASVPIAPFHMYRAEQLLSDLAQQGFADAAQLLARLKTSTAREGGGEL
ncbi:unnamed protein product [Durusdinium trenchii]|uniref:Ribosomal protein L10e/L16 domain-containing protein n=1 Tax=Durusdinium trenchii TaxID=1381693 RepID=A0ABP0J8P6_9DINO